MKMQSAISEVSLETLIPDLLQRHPQARAVLDQYGLRGCGGRNGPHESLGYFARMHGVAEAPLMAELRQAIAQGSHAVEATIASVADTIYRRFFVAGILVTLTVGVGWGVWLLWQIGLGGDFTSASIQHINAHGHAQIFGWVGLFIMGFAYQAFPRFWHGSLVWPPIAILTFIVMLVGLSLVTIGMSLPPHPWTVICTLAGGGLELCAISIFAIQIIVTFMRSKVAFEPYMAFIFASLAFFVVQTVFGHWHIWKMITAGTHADLLNQIQSYQVVLRDLQIHGMALFMILGVSLRLLPGLLDLPAISSRVAWTCFAMLLIGVIGECTLFIAYRHTGQRAFAYFLPVAWGMLATGSLLFAWRWRLWRIRAAGERSAKFIQIGYLWLAVSMGMLLALPIYNYVSGLAFSHAYFGAVRHAITVGFVSMMIMGVAAKIVPTLNGIDPRRLSALWGPFLLVNIGCLLRVSFQTLTDWHPLFFRVVGVSGVLELIGMAWWGCHIIAIIRQGKREAGNIDESPPASSRPPRILSSHIVADVIQWFPQTLPVFDRFGFGMLRNPLMRRTVARQVTLNQAAAMKGVAVTTLLESLNAAAQLPGADPETLPCVRYDMPLGELIERYPYICHPLNPLPVNYHEMTIEQAAHALGIPRENFAATIAWAIVHSAHPCNNPCESQACSSRHSDPVCPHQSMKGAV